MYVGCGSGSGCTVVGVGSAARARLSSPDKNALIAVIVASEDADIAAVEAGGG